MSNINLANVPAVLELTNVGNGVKKIRGFKTNSEFSIAAGDTLSILVDTSIELAYWLSQEDDSLTVTQTGATVIAVPAGGASGATLVKASAADFDVKWSN